jgi:hypothetical protein
MLCTFKTVFLVIATIASIFYSWKAHDIHLWPHSADVELKMKTSWWIHQYWLNFVGCAIGWVAAYYFIFCRLLSHDFSFELKDIFPVLVALLGITGLLPYTLSKLNSIVGQ